MRISDWSSDVCSSDLRPHLPGARRLSHDGGGRRRRLRHPAEPESAGELLPPFGGPHAAQPRVVLWRCSADHHPDGDGHRRPEGRGRGRCGDRKSTRLELQSLMRISYAVFCLKKKKKSQLNVIYTTYYSTLQ